MSQVLTPDIRTSASNQAVLKMGAVGVKKAIAQLCRENFLVFQKVELGMEIGPQHRLWWDHLRTGEDICEMAPRDHGKAIIHTEPVLTTRGWKTHGTLEIGDKVFTPEGDQVAVIGVGKACQQAYRVTFSDGNTIQCHLSHEWEITDRKTRRASGKRKAGVKQERTYITRVMETRQLLAEGLELGGKENRKRFWLPHTKALRYSLKDLPIDPYVLGVWLGDGCGTYGWIHQGAADADAIYNEVGKHYTHSKERIHPDTGVKVRVYDFLTEDLQSQGLLKCTWTGEHRKHIPDLYKRASIRQRLELLAGLIDTDGCVEYVKQRGRDYTTQRVRFVNANKRLIEDVEELCRGLGFLTSKDEAEPALSSSGIQGKQTVYYLRITPTLDIPCRLERKKITGDRSKKLSSRSIVSITPCEPSPGRCIQIDDPRGVYLVGRTLIPTHNSMSLARAYPIWKAKYDPWVKEVMILGADQPSAVENLDKIKEIMAASPSLSYLLPVGLSGGMNSRTEVRLKNGKILRAKGIMSPLRGRHPQLIVLDDILNEKNSWSEESRREVIRYFNEVVVPMKDKGNRKDRLKGFKSQIVIIGTAQDYGDMYHVLQKNDAYVGIKLSAIVDEEKRTALWSERYTYEDLMDIKRRVGALAFSQEYLNNPLTDETTIFPTTLFAPLFDSELSYSLNYTGSKLVYLGVDFSVPGSTDGDWTVIVALEYDPSENIYTLLNYWRARPSSIQEQIKQIEYYSQLYRITLGYLEDNSFQGIYREHFKKKSNLPLRGHTVTGQKKKSLETGLVSLRPIFENGGFRLPYKTESDRMKTDYIVSEFNGVRQRHGRIGNETTHDDIVMGIWHAVSASKTTLFSADFG